MQIDWKFMTTCRRPLEVLDLGCDPLDQNFRKFRYRIKWNGYNYVFKKLVSKILINLWRLSFFPEIWKFWKVSVPCGIPFRISSRQSAVLVLASCQNGNPQFKYMIILYIKTFRKNFGSCDVALSYNMLITLKP